MANSLAEELRNIGACAEAAEWVGERSLSDAWRECRRADWMLWLCGRMADRDGWPSRKEVILVVCEIAESSLRIFEEHFPRDKRPRRAIEVARAWARGDSSGKFAAAFASASAAYAAAATYAADNLAYAAASAAATYAAAYAATYAAAVQDQKGDEMCALIRERLKIPRSLIPNKNLAIRKAVING